MKHMQSCVPCNMSDAVVWGELAALVLHACLQRNMKIAEALKAEAEAKRKEALKLAREWEEAKKAAQEAAEVLRSS